MKVLHNLKDYLNQVNQESLKEEKDHLEYEINFFIEKIQILKDQILKSNSLEPLSKENLDQEFANLVSQVRNLVLIQTKLCSLQDKVLIHEESTNQRQAQIFEILIFIENFIAQHVESYQEFTIDEDISDYTQFANSFDQFIKKHASSKLYEKIQSRISTMHRKAVQFSKSNQKLQLAKANLQSFNQEIDDLEIIVEIQTPDAEFKYSNPVPFKLIEQSITPILEGIHEENIEQLRSQAALEIQKRSQEFSEKLQVANKRLQIVVLLSALPLALIFLFKELEVEGQNQEIIETPKGEAFNIQQPQVNQLQDYLYNQSLQRSLQQQEDSSSMQSLIETQKEFEQFKSQLEASNMIEISTPENIQLYSYQGENIIHYLFYSSKDQHYAFDALTTNIHRIKHSINTIYGVHTSVTMHNFSFNPGTRLKFSNIESTLY
ncbi:hypothetical protein HOJ01_04215 [bacterium]|jgi:hypothetical protein|nr:hypothetical protein [bacterium]MBT6293983.1 hypothetical protein [bacterium]